MSEPKLISPMLDNFAMGDPFTDHNGVRCCPAMEKNTDNKYIVKIISVPSSPNQLEAFLLSGVYSDVDAALSYYKQIADGIVEEAQTLQQLSALEGFVSYEGWQVVPMEDNKGFDVYLLGTYKHTLQHHFRRNPMTHLGALNLGLDLCAALAASRRSGYIYADLKPENIYITGEHEYRIGDIGFLKLDSLKYTSLPDRYRSQYTAPEIADALSTLNTTVDVYALGLILYQAFNDGSLPFREDTAPCDVFPPPAYADYEMAEIILKACAPDPDARWQDPIEMGQALVSYMQRNGAHDTPIVPVIQADEPAAACETDTDEPQEDVTEVEADIPAEAQTETESEDTSDGQIYIDVQTSEDSKEDDSVYTEDSEGNLTFLSSDIFEETVPEEDVEQINYNEVSDDVSDMLVQADELIAHPAPEPVIPPEPVDVPVPPPLPIEEPDSEEISDETDDNAEAEPEAETDEPVEQPVGSDETDDDAETNQKPKSGHWLRNTAIAMITIAILVLGFFYYKNYYLQPIESIHLDESESGNLTVYVTSQTDERKLTVVCSDTYGNQLTSPVHNGKATFTNLAPNSAYTVKVIINGFHKLTGITDTAFTTPQQSNIVQFNAVTGSEDGSVILSFTIDGPDSDQWTVRYTADGEEEKETTFAGRMVNITGLTVGKVYDFNLVPVNDIQTTGTTNIQHTASKIVKAENLMITSCVNSVLTATWSAPEGEQVESWTVRCYNDNGYDQTIVAADTNAAFEGVDSTSGYTVEVMAAGMSVSQRAFADANAITVGLTVDDTDPDTIKLSWEPAMDNPKKGWLLQYTVDGSSAQELACNADNTALLTTKIPGAHYTFTLQSADGTPVLGGVVHYKTAPAESFTGYDVTAESMEFKMCKTPKAKNWDRYDLKKSDYTTAFKPGAKASFLVKMKQEYSTSSDKITTLFVIRDANGAVVSSASVSKAWTKMWYRNYCELDIPSIPKEEGNYTVSVYFNGMLVNEQEFTIAK